MDALVQPSTGRSLTDPSHDVSMARSSYTLAQVADCYNDLQDVKAYTETLKRSNYPAKVLSQPAQQLGTVLVDIDDLGAVASAAFAEPPAARDPVKFPIAYAWLNLERPDHADPLHSNILVWQGDRVTRFEPHGSDVRGPGVQACGFRSFYNPAAMDEALAKLLVQHRLIPSLGHYTGPDPAFPVLPQSYSRNDSSRNSAPVVPGTAFKRRRNGAGLGDSFCGAWTLMYLSLVCKGDKSPLTTICGSSSTAGAASKGSDVDAGSASGSAHEPGGTPSTASLEDRGRAGADLIADFILQCHKAYEGDIDKMNRDSGWAQILGAQ